MDWDRTTKPDPGPAPRWAAADQQIDTSPSYTQYAELIKTSVCAWIRSLSIELGVDPMWQSPNRIPAAQGRSATVTTVRIGLSPLVPTLDAKSKPAVPAASHSSGSAVTMSTSTVVTASSRTGLPLSTLQRRRNAVPATAVHRRPMRQQMGVVPRWLDGVRYGDRWLPRRSAGRRRRVVVRRGYAGAASHGPGRLDLLYGGAAAAARAAVTKTRCTDLPRSERHVT
jgi:hypothetical protein